MSSDEAELLEQLDWIDNLEDGDSGISQYSKPRYARREDLHENNYRILCWWEYQSKESLLDEWDEDVQFYDENTDTFRKWAKKHYLDFETISLLRSLQLDDMAALPRMSANQLSFLRSSAGFASSNLARALDSLEIEVATRSVDFGDDAFYEDPLFGDEKESSLRPNITRNMPLRRSTRSGKKATRNVHIRGDGIMTVGPGATRSKLGYNDTRRLSWETFTFNTPSSSSSNKTDKKQAASSSKSGKHSSVISLTPSPKSKNKSEHFKFSTSSSHNEKKDKGRRSKGLFPTVAQI